MIIDIALLIIIVIALFKATVANKKCDELAEYIRRIIELANQDAINLNELRKKMKREQSV